ncbi:rod shape-determining protein MreC, partial [Salmonella enterica subsp. enterica serovar Oslo]|nr:rod shape-determining protein MreC [Salmonella enterica subsp. enterica serovar Oslo]
NGANTMTPEQGQLHDNERPKKKMTQVLPSPAAKGTPEPHPGPPKGMTQPSEGHTATVSTQPSPSGATPPPTRATGG